jgi:hypothetical protein
MSFVIQGGSPEVDMYVKGSRIFPGAKTANGVTYGDTETTDGGIYLIPFFVPGKLTFSEIGIHTAGTLSVDIIAGVYKYDYDADRWDKITQVGPFDSTAGVKSESVGSSITLEQGLHATAMTADGVASDVTGYDVNSFGNFAGQMWSGAARSSFHFKKTAVYAATMPATIAGVDANAGGSAGDDIPGCFLLLA